MKGDFTAIVDSVENDVIHMHQADGRKRNVVVTPITTIKKWNADVPMQGLRKGDELKITERRARRWQHPGARNHGHESRAVALGGSNAEGVA